MSLITSRTVLSDRAAVGASARKIVNERAVQGAEAARESENTLSDLQATATQRIQKAVERKSTLKNDTLRNGIVTSRTTLKSLKYSDFIQSQKLESPTDLKVFSNTGASVGQHRSPDTKSGLGLQVEKRIEDVIRLTKATVNSPQAIKFQTNQALLNQSVAINDILRGNKPDIKQVAIGAARVAGVTASAIAQAAGSGTGLRVVQGFVPLNGGYVVDTGRFGLLGAAVDSLNPFGTGDTQISKANLALRGKTINDGFIGTEFEEAGNILTTRTNPTTVRRPEDRTTTNLPVGQQGVYLLKEFFVGKPVAGQKIQISDQSVRTEFVLKDPIAEGSKEAKKNESFSQIDVSGPDNFIQGDTGVPSISTGTRTERRLNRKKINILNTGSLDSRFYTRVNEKETDKVNFLNIKTTEINNAESDIIPFTIQNLPANTTNSEFLYFRAYLDSMSDSYNGEWSGTRYIGRAEELYNYTGFKRGLQFSFKIAAHSKEELKPLYEKLNRLAGTTAPTYQNGLFMQGVFSKITIGDYVQKLPGFFTNVDFAWQTAYPWEIGNVDSGAASGDTPRVPHILDVSVSFQPVHDFAPQYDKTFIGFPSNTSLPVNG